MTLLPGVYKFNGATTMNGMLTLYAKGDTAAVWIFQIGTSLLIAEGSSIIFKDSIGNIDYVYWQVGSSATLAIGVSMVGNIMALASITVNNGATVKGRCLARNAAVTLDNSVVTKPKTVSFCATKTILGICLEEYITSPELFSATFKKAIAETMTGVLPSNIKNFKVSAGSTTATTSTVTSTIDKSSAKFLRSVTIARTLSSSCIVLKYDVVVSFTMTAEELQAQLNAAVSDGLFDSYLQAAAVEKGATDLQNSSSETIDTETISDDTTDFTSSTSEPNSSSGLATVFKIGIIVGVVVLGVSVLALIACWWIGCFSTHRNSSSAVHAGEV